MKKPKMKVIEVNDPEQIAELFQALGMDVPQELQDAMKKAEQPEEEKCGNPLCPCCCFKGATPEENSASVKQVMEMLTKEEATQAATLFFGIAAGAYMAAPSPYDHEVGKAIASVVAMLRKTNPEFAFATTPNDINEGVAKH